MSSVNLQWIPIRMLLRLSGMLVLFSTTIVIFYILRGLSPYKDVSSLKTRNKQQDEGNRSVAITTETPFSAEDRRLLSQYLSRLDGMSIVPKMIGNFTCTNMPNRTGPCIDPGCRAQWQQPRDRLEKMLSTQRPIEPQYLEAIDRNMTRGTHGRSDVIFITGGSSDHWRESQALFKDLEEKVFPFMRRHTNFTFHLVYYNLGLTKEQSIVLKKYCNCTVIAFPFRLLPKLVGRQGYAWKPLVVKAHLAQARKFLVWMDASPRFYHGNISSFFRHAETNGVFMTSPAAYMLPQHVKRETFDYFKLEPCLMAPVFEMESGFLVFRNDLLNRRAIVDPWVSCAFSDKCICIGEDCRQWYYRCEVRGKMYHRCSRFDQSALAVILAGLYDWRVSSVGVPVSTYIKTFVFRRNHRVDYFPTPAPAPVRLLVKVKV